MKLPQYILKSAQIAVGVTADGKIGPKTRAAMRCYDGKHEGFTLAGLRTIERQVVAIAQHASGAPLVSGVLDDASKSAIREFFNKHAKSAPTKSQGWQSPDKPISEYTVDSLASTKRSIAVNGKHYNVDLASDTPLYLDGFKGQLGKSKQRRIQIYGDARRLGESGMSNLMRPVTGLPGRWNKGNGRLYAFHPKAAGQLRLALILCEAYGVINEIYRIGSYNYRHMRFDTTRPLSMHSWGIAVDINPRDNSAKGRAESKKLEPFTDSWWSTYPQGLSQLLVACFKKAGFRWGGDWPTFRDPMHFEIA